MKVLVTSGGTRIPIDRVRHIANMSQGTFGAEIAKHFLLQGHQVEFLRADRSKSPFQLSVDFDKVPLPVAVLKFAEMTKLANENLCRYHETTYKTFAEYAAALKMLICSRKKADRPDIVFLAAAVSDYGTTPIDGKVRSKDSDMSIQLHKLPKLISEVKQWNPDVMLVGFKLLVDSTPEELGKAAMKSLTDNKCDMVIANDLRDIQQDNHTLRIALPDSDVSVMRKNDMDMSLAERVVKFSLVLYDLKKDDLRVVMKRKKKA
jgi:phosphopantothenate-cysteine ligase